jgi:hypothetical protein
MVNGHRCTLETEKKRPPFPRGGGDRHRLNTGNNIRTSLPYTREGSVRAVVAIARASSKVARCQRAKSHIGFYAGKAKGPGALAHKLNGYCIVVIMEAIVTTYRERHLLQPIACTP